MAENCGDFNFYTAFQAIRNNGLGGKVEKCMGHKARTPKRRTEKECWFDIFRLNYKLGFFNMNQMTNDEFKAWREFMGLTQKAAGRVLGISAEAVKSYERGAWSDERPATPSITVSRLCWMLRNNKETSDAIQLLAKGK